MKRQAAVQAYELNEFYGSGQGMTPPEGTVKVGNPYPDVGEMLPAAQAELANPVAANLDSLKNGEVQFQTFCTPCHGAKGWGNGSVAGPPFGTGPFGLVLPVAGPSSIAKVRTDGHIYTTITLGRGRMPSYQRISPNDRWDIVNYLRDLNGQGGRQ
jgi:mono/diheme cytochrome c family protein